MSAVLGSGEHRYRVVENWAKLPDGWEFMDVGAVAVDSKDQVYVFNRGEHPMMVFDRAGQLPALLGRGRLPARARAAHRCPRQSLLHRRRRPHRAPVLDRGQDRAHHRRSRQARALHERRAVPSLHAHRALAQGRDLRLGRLRQCARAQVLARRQAADVLGRVGHRAGPVQHRPQHRHRRRRLGLRCRPREPPRAGVRRQRQIRDAVEQPAPPVRPLLLPRQEARPSSSASSARACASISRRPTWARVFPSSTPKAS